MYLYHMTTSANQNYFCYYETEQPCARGQYKKKEILLWKQTGRIYTEQK